MSTVEVINGDVPLSVAYDEFIKALLDLNVEMLSDLKFENYRDKEGKRQMVCLLQKAEP